MAGTQQAISQGGQTALDVEAAEIESKQAQAAAQPTLSSQIAQDASQADITNEDLFPGMNQKINVGSSSSQTLGTQPIFVAAGQYVPYNILNKKEEAIATATKKRAERQAKFDPGKAGQLKNQLYQRDLNEGFNRMNSEVIKTAQSMYPDNWDVALNDPGTEIGKLYAQQKSNFEVLATESNVLFEKAAQVIADKETGGPTLHSDASRQLAYEIQNRSGKAVDGKSLEDLRPLVDKFNGSFDLDKHLADNKVVSQMKADITSLLTPEHGGLTTQETSDWSQRIEAYAESETATEAGRYYNDNIIKKQDIIDRLSSMLGVSKTKSHKNRTVGAAAGKAVTVKQRADKRYKTIKKGMLDPNSSEARALAESLAGSKYAGGIVTKSEMSSPEDYKDIISAASNLTDFYNTNKDLMVKGITRGLLGTNAKTGTDEFKKELLDKFNTQLTNAGLEGGLKSVTIDKDNNNLIHIVDSSGLKETVDMSKKNALEDYYLGDAAEFKNTSSVKLTYDKNGRSQTSYLDLNNPASFRLYNTLLNSTVGEDLKVDQVLIDEMKEAEPDVWSGGKKTTSTQGNQQQASGDRAKELKSKYPKATPKHIQSFIDNNATDDQIKAFFESKKK